MLLPLPRALILIVAALAASLAWPVVAQQHLPQPDPALHSPLTGWRIEARPGQLGRSRDALQTSWDERFGADGWQLAYLIQGRLYPREAVLLLYEDAYLAWFVAHPEGLEWLCATASDVYDNAPSNVESGLDYGHQETDSNHYQDIAIRRALVRLGRWFDGDHLVEVRSRRSEGGHLSPGQLPFHHPDWILQPALEGWWEPGSIEDFYQSNKVLVVRER